MKPPLEVKIVRNLIAWFVRTSGHRAAEISADGALTFICLSTQERLTAAEAQAGALRTELDQVRMELIGKHIQTTLARQTTQAYARHRTSCAYYHEGPGAACTCGLSARMAEVMEVV